MIPEDFRARTVVSSRRLLTIAPDYPLLAVSRYRYCQFLLPGQPGALVEAIERDQKMATKSLPRRNPKKTAAQRMTKPRATKTAATQKASTKPLSKMARIEETQTKIRATMRVGGMVGRVSKSDTNKLRGLGPMIAAARKYWKGVDGWVAEEFPKWQPATRRHKTA